MTRDLLGAAALVVLALAAAAPARAAECRLGDTRVLPGRSMCLDGFTTTCLPRGAWAIDRQLPCVSGGAVEHACRVSATELAAPGARNCNHGRLRQCSQRGDWIDLAGSC